MPIAGVCPPLDLSEVRAVLDVKMDFDAYLPRVLAARRVNVTTAVVDAWLARGWLDDQGERQRLRTKLEEGARSIHHGDLLRAHRDTGRRRGQSHRRLTYKDELARRGAA